MPKIACLTSKPPRLKKKPPRARPFDYGMRSARRNENKATRWEFATGGGGIVEPDFAKCILAQNPRKPPPPTQPY